MVEYLGVCKWYNPTKGYGFIIPDDKSGDVFFHRTDLEKSGLKGIDEGQRVSFQKKEKKGRFNAFDIRLI